PAAGVRLGPLHAAGAAPALRAADRAVPADLSLRAAGVERDRGGPRARGHEPALARRLHRRAALARHPRVPPRDFPQVRLTAAGSLLALETAEANTLD